MSPRRRCLTLIKGRQRFVFTYAEGREPDLLAALAKLADDPASPFDWLDAAALSLQVGRQAQHEPEAATE